MTYPVIIAIFFFFFIQSRFDILCVSSLNVTWSWRGDRGGADWPRKRIYIDYFMRLKIFTTGQWAVNSYRFAVQ